jgi:hypothetical protein
VASAGVIGEMLVLADRFEERFHVFRVLLLIGYDLFHHGTRGGIVIAQVADYFVVGLNRYPFRHQIFPNDLQQRSAFDVLRMAAGRQPFGIEVGRAA